MGVGVNHRFTPQTMIDYRFTPQTMIDTKPDIFHYFQGLLFVGNLNLAGSPGRFKREFARDPNGQFLSITVQFRKTLLTWQKTKKMG